MCQDNYNSVSGKDENLTYDDRKSIAHLYNIQNKNFTEIVNESNFYRISISREIKKVYLNISEE